MNGSGQGTRFFGRLQAADWPVNGQKGTLRRRNPPVRAGPGAYGPVYTVECSTIHGEGRRSQTVNRVLNAACEGVVTGMGTGCAHCGRSRSGAGRDVYDMATYCSG